MAFLAFFSYTILFTFASEKFVKVSNISTGQNDSEEFIQFNSAIWKAKKDNTLSLKDEIAKATAPETLKSVEVELKAMHNIKEIKFEGKESIVLAKN